MPMMKPFIFSEDVKEFIKREKIIIAKIRSKYSVDSYGDWNLLLKEIDKLAGEKLK